MNRFSNNIGGKLKFRLITLVFLEYAVWGAYLISIGRYLAQAGLGSQIKWFFATNGIVSLFMPALVGIIADRYIQAQRLLAVCHLLAGALMLSAGIYCLGTDQVMFDSLYPLYALSIPFFMPTVALTNSVSYSIITRAGGDPVKDYPPIRLFGTVGFICSMLAVNFIKIGGVQMQDSYTQLIMSGVISLILCIYSLTLPECPTGGKRAERSVAEAFGISAFRLFGQRHMAVFFVFCILMGSALQITNGYANTFLSSFSSNPAMADTFAVKNSNALLSLSQISETLCFLLVPFCMKRFGIKKVLLMSMIAWVLRFGLFGIGTPDMPGVLLFILSCILYGIAFDFFNIAGSLYVEQNVDKSIRASAQGLFMMMSNGVGATIGMMGAGAVMDRYVFMNSMPDWSSAWLVFAGYMVAVAALFAVFFKENDKKR
ncbi:MAG: MFS transporter [Bacteroidaceae bacterium]|nr:MFS transporter [Bacteroidaceae bacterium]